MKHRLGVIGYGNMGSWHCENVRDRIEELEEKIKSLEKELSKKEAKFALTRQENRKIAQEVRREQVIEKIYTESREFKGENKRLREEIKTLIGKLCLKNAEIETLKAQLGGIS